MHEDDECMKSEDQVKRHEDEDECMQQNHEVRKVDNEKNVGNVCTYLSALQSNFQIKYIGAVESITDPFFLEGVLYIKRTSHVSISVSMRMALER